MRFINDVNAEIRQHLGISRFNKMTSLEYPYYVDINDENRHIIENYEELIELMRSTLGNTRGYQIK